MGVALTRGFILELSVLAPPFRAGGRTSFVFLCFMIILRSTMAPSSGIHRRTLLTFVIGLSAGFLCTYVAVTNHPNTEISMSKVVQQNVVAVPSDPHSHGEMDSLAGPDETVQWNDFDQESHHGKHISVF